MPCAPQKGDTAKISGKTQLVSLHHLCRDGEIADHDRSTICRTSACQCFVQTPMFEEESHLGTTDHGISIDPTAHLLNLLYELGGLPCCREPGRGQSSWLSTYSSLAVCLSLPSVYFSYMSALYTCLVLNSLPSSHRLSFCVRAFETVKPAFREHGTQRLHNLNCSDVACPSQA